VSGGHASAASVRERIDHPILDCDGHVLEFRPAVRELFAEEAGASLLPAFDRMLDVWSLAKRMTPGAMRSAGLFRMTWWGFPARNTLDRATTMLPRLMYERLDELGLDFAVLYPTYGLGALSVDDEALRRAAARAYNRYYAETTAGLGDRLAPVAVIPMHTPQEAVAELEYAVKVLGFKVAVLAGNVRRPLDPPPGVDPTHVPRAAGWIDTFGVDSAFDYDPVWRACIELGIAPTFHSSGMGWPGRASVSSYVFNHVGNFAVAGEATCRALFFGGVTRRFPALRCAFLEGGAGWAATLASDLLGHFEKRGAQHIRHYDPNAIDRARMREWFAKYADPRSLAHAGELDAALGILSDPDEDEAALDEFAACGMRSPEDLRALFVEPFHFGCEADDPRTAHAFDRRTNPLGLPLKAVFSSDVGHWDVPDMRDVVGEAWELVEHGMLSEADFRAFTFDNPLSLWCGANPRFFDGTRVEGAVASALARR